LPQSRQNLRGRMEGFESRSPATAGRGGVDRSANRRRRVTESLLALQTYFVATKRFALRSLGEGWAFTKVLFPSESWFFVC